MRFYWSPVSAALLSSCSFFEHEPSTRRAEHSGAVADPPRPPSAGASGATAVLSGGAGGGGAGGTGPEPRAPASGAPGAAAAGSPSKPLAPGPPYTFPQNKRSIHCIYPALADPDPARAAYQRWKRELVTSEGANGYARVRRPGSEQDTTVSEGIAYGMILAVVMDEPLLFDQFWKYSRQPGFLTERGLMHWKILPSGMVAPDGLGAATDADEDMAWALVLADKKWGGKGTLDEEYIDLAKAQIQRIWDHEIDHGRGDLVLAGDSWGPTIAFNPSYFAPNQYRLFGIVSGNVAGWNRVIDTGYQHLFGTLSTALGNAENGLVPAWGLDGSGMPARPWDGAPMNYQYDSARIPFRIGQDYCEFGEPRAKLYLDKISGFFSGIGAANLLDGYELDGTPRPENPSQQAALFVGAAAVGAMSDPRHQRLVDEAYGLLVMKEMLPPSYYYNLTWQVFSLAMLSGNLLDYTLHP